MLYQDHFGNVARAQSGSIWNAIPTSMSAPMFSALLQSIMETEAQYRAKAVVVENSAVAILLLVGLLVTHFLTVSVVKQCLGNLEYLSIVLGVKYCFDFCKELSKVQGETSRLIFHRSPRARIDPLKSDICG